MSAFISRTARTNEIPSIPGMQMSLTMTLNSAIADCAQCGLCVGSGHRRVAPAVQNPRSAWSGTPPRRRRRGRSAQCPARARLLMPPPCRRRQPRAPSGRPQPWVSRNRKHCRRAGCSRPRSRPPCASMASRQKASPSPRPSAGVLLPVAIELYVLIEDLRLELQRHARAAVPDLEQELCPHPTRHLQANVRPGRGVLGRVLHKVLDDAANEVSVGLNRSQLRSAVDDDRMAGIPLTPAQVGSDLAQQIQHIHRFELRRQDPVLASSDVQKVVQHPVHGIRGGVDVPERLLQRLAERGAVEHVIGIAQNATQRASQIVHDHRRQTSFLLLRAQQCVTLGSDEHVAARPVRPSDA